MIPPIVSHGGVTTGLLMLFYVTGELVKFTFFHYMFWIDMNEVFPECRECPFGNGRSAVYQSKLIHAIILRFKHKFICCLRVRPS